jgi:Flp pilus assembly protein CpaB
MRIQTVGLLVVAVVCGTAGSRLAKRLFSSPPATTPEVEQRVTVWAAKQPLSAGTIFRDPERWFEERSIVKSEVPDKSVNRLYQLRGRRLARALDNQAIVTTEHLAEEEREGAALLKQEGRQALDIAVVLPAENLLLPDARVDVLSDRRTDPASAEASLIARHLPLLGVRPVDKQTVLATLAVTPAEAQQLRQAAAVNPLRLVPSQKR